MSPGRPRPTGRTVAVPDAGLGAADVIALLVSLMLMLVAAFSAARRWRSGDTQDFLPRRPRGHRRKFSMSPG